MCCKNVDNLAYVYNLVLASVIASRLLNIILLIALFQSSLGLLLSLLCGCLTSHAYFTGIFLLILFVCASPAQLSILHILFGPSSSHDLLCVGTLFRAYILLLTLRDNFQDPQQFVSTGILG